MFKSIGAGVVLAMMLTGARAQDTQTDPVRAAFESSTLPGFCGVAVDHERIRDERAGGFADAAHERAYDQRTIQRVASVSKTVLGLVLARLSVDGQIDLDAPIDTYLPWRVRNPRFADTPITLRQLATHTSSLIDRDEIYAKTYQPGDTPTLTQLDFVRRYTDAKGEWFAAANFGEDAPGARYAYSNMGANLAAVVVEHVTHEPFDAYAARHIFKPIGMVDTSLTYRPVAKDRRATLFDAAGKPLAPYALVTYADGGLFTTCHDLALYLRAVLRAQAGESSPLSSAAVKLALSLQFAPDHLPQDFKRDNQGLFWQYHPTAGIGHSGGDAGVTAHAYLDRAMTRGHVLIINASAEDSEAIANGVRDVWRAWQKDER